MKKFFTFAIMALLIGGFAFNASAQDKKASNSIKTSKKTVKQEVQQTQQPKKEAKGEDWNKVLKEYEQAVDNCVKIYQKMQKSGVSGKDVSKEFNAALTKAENLKKKIEGAKASLDRTQVDRFNKANQKLQQVYAKG